MALETHWEFFLKVCYWLWAITYHLGNVNPYNKDDAQQQKFMEDIVVICCQSLHANFYCGKLVVKAFGHTLKSPCYVS